MPWQLANMLFYLLPVINNAFCYLQEIDLLKLFLSLKVLRGNMGNFGYKS